MKPIRLLLYLLLLSFTSCITIVKWRYGITNPKEQTPEKLIAFLEKHKYPDSCQYIFSDSASCFKTIRNPVFRKKMFSHMIFDSGGTLLKRDTAACQWSGYDVIKSLNPDSAYVGLNGVQLDEILGHIQPTGSKPEPDAISVDHDFTVIVTWAKFLGTYNSRLFELAGAVQQNRTARIRMIWLNLDMQESWNLTSEQKMEIR